MRKDWRFGRALAVFLLIAFGIVCVGFAIVGAVRYWQWRNEPPQILRAHIATIQIYVDNIESGKISALTPDGEYPILNVLQDRGVTHVRKIGNRIVMIFAFMPTDAVPELWYSPDGFTSEWVAERKKSKAFFEWKQIDNHWGYCLWDN